MRSKIVKRSAVISKRKKVIMAEVYGGKEGKEKLEQTVDHKVLNSLPPSTTHYHLSKISEHEIRQAINHMTLDFLVKRFTIDELKEELNRRKGR